MIGYAWLSSFSGNIAALAVAAGGYLVYKLVRRVRCASHTSCCDIELVKPETMRGAMSEPRLIDLIRSLNNKQEDYAKRPDAGPEPWRADKVPLDHAGGHKRPEGQAQPVRSPLYPSEPADHLTRL